MKVQAYTNLVFDFFQNLCYNKYVERGKEPNQQI